MSELLPCPFCGGEANTLEEPYVVDVRYSVGCNDDECRGFIGLSWLYKTEAEATAAWNTRAERTCKEYGSVRVWQSCNVWSHELSCGHEVDTLEKEQPNYCEVCGAKVVDSPPNHLEPF